MARWNILPSAVLDGHLRKIPMPERVCPCGKVESIEHILLHSCFYQETREKINASSLGRCTVCSGLENIRKFLVGMNPQITLFCEKFLAATHRICKEIT